MRTRAPHPSFRTAVLAALLVAGSAVAETVTYQAGLDGGNEVPPVTTAAVGTATLVVDTDTLLGEYTLEFSGLSSPQTGAHFHFGAPGVVGTLLEQLPLRSPASGTWAMSQQEFGWLTNGEIYINVHTQLHVGGEIRGQLVLANTVADEALSFGAVKALYR